MSSLVLWKCWTTCWSHQKITVHRPITLPSTKNNLLWFDSLWVYTVLLQWCTWIVHRYNNIDLYTNSCKHYFLTSVFSSTLIMLADNIQLRRNYSFDLFDLGPLFCQAQVVNWWHHFDEETTKKNILAGSLKGEYNCCCSVLKTLFKCHSTHSDWLSSPPPFCPLSMLSLSFKTWGGLFTSLE